MRLNCVVFCAIISLGSVFLACSRSDLITDVGSEVVKGVDSTLTGSDDRFVRIDLGGGDVKSYSLPDGADPAFSTQYGNQAGGVIMVGVSSKGGDTLAAHAQFRAVPLDTASRLYDTAYKPARAYLYFSAADTPDDDSAALGGDSIAVYRSGTLQRPASVIRSDTADLAADSGACAGAAAPCDFRTKIFLADSGKADSILLPASIRDSIFNVRISGDTNAVFDFAFSIANYTGKARRIRNPYVIISAVSKDTGAAAGAPVSDTISANLTRFTAFENADTAAARALIAYTSKNTSRTAVFEIDLGKIADSLEAGYTNLNAVITIKPGQPDTSSYRVFVSGAQIPNADSLNARLAASQALRPVTPYNTLSATKINPSIDSVLKGTKKLYVYLRAASDDGVIVWGEPAGLETIFTPSR